MEENSLQTDYDTCVQTRELQMLKAMLPFVHSKNQLPLALIIQSMEIRNVMQMFQYQQEKIAALSIDKDSDKRSAMLKTLKRFCTPKERESIDNILNIMCIMESMEDPNGRFFT